MKKCDMYEELLEAVYSLTGEIIEILANTEGLSEEELAELEGLYAERGLKLEEFNKWYITPEAASEIKGNRAFWNERFLKLRELDNMHAEILKQRTHDTKESLRKMMQNKSVFLYTQK